MWISIKAIVMHRHTRLHDSRGNKRCHHIKMNTTVLWQSSYFAVDHPQKLRYEELQLYWSFGEEIAIIYRVFPSKEE